MNIFIKGHSFEYEIEKLTRLFFPFEKIMFLYDSPVADNDNLFAEATVEDGGGDEYSLFARAYFNGNSAERRLKFTAGLSGDTDTEKETEHKLAALLFECYAELTGYKPEWGILTGIRPAKLYRKFAAELGERDADRFFKEEFKVAENKLKLLKKTAALEDEIISQSRPDSVSIYISIPFCPTRCSYCSFVSHSIERAAELIPEYLEYLCKEIEETAKIVNNLNLKVMTVYVGGGTPTTLSAEQLTLLLSKIKSCFGDNFGELTVEAGRPDTISEEKLIALKNGGVSRISINPQTMNDNVLKQIGRRHTSAQTVVAFKLARKVGLDNINMDLIAGLPTDSFESFKQTVDSVIALNPESVTVHSLSLKRSSGMGVSGDYSYIKDADVAAKMVEYANEKLSLNDIKPYYMYRQSKTVGNLENVGYSKAGFEGIYNVYIMDETHTILACGASAVTKLKATDGAIERIFNYKYPYEYISNFDEMLRRKNRVEEFYREHPFKNK